MEMIFWRTAAGAEPAREFLKTLPKADRVVVGTDLRTVQLGFPIGMPLCRPMGGGLYEARSSVQSKREVRCLFAHAQGTLWVLHAFIKKSMKTPPRELELARTRMASITT